MSTETIRLIRDKEKGSHIRGKRVWKWGKR